MGIPNYIQKRTCTHHTLHIENSAELKKPCKRVRVDEDSDLENSTDVTNLPIDE